MEDGMWQIQEHKNVLKVVRKLPPWIVKEYDAWKEIVSRHGPEVLRQFPGYHDEMLKGSRQGQRSSRLSRQYRVIYTVQRDRVAVYVLEVTAHKY